ncbi:hypothetical protein WMY93_018189 [Mugilogobius chulae]|uniref:Uncharacterized protein n=1 Tax=Mugilogobius chulae TaxID=88201 RepID=A0AAW0NN59_9GOBI
MSSNKEHDRSTLCSISLGDLRQSPATERKLESITTAINKEMNVTVSEEDKKIAALMLARHEEEQLRLELSYKEEQERHEARHRQEAEKMEAEKKRLTRCTFRGIRERVAQEEEQIQRAKLRAHCRTQKNSCTKEYCTKRVRGGWRKHSARFGDEQEQSHAGEAEEQTREMCHQLVREKLQAEEEQARRVRESCVVMKEWKIERLRRQREQIQEEAHRLARASFQLRDRVRQHTNNNSSNFDQMVKEAQLNAAVGHLKLV